MLLRPHPTRSAHPGPLCLVVLDGVGLGRRDEGDAVFLARTPTLDQLATRSWLPLRAHGTAVGMPSDDDMGNSEVGHNTLGGGRVFEQGARLVERALAEGSTWKSAAWREIIDGPRAGAGLHFIGLLSDGNVHSHERHLFALLDRAATEGARRVFVHVLLDGRDVPEGTGLLYVERLEAHLGQLRARHGGVFAIASGGGRMFVTMDRYDSDWSIVERGWRAHVHGEGASFPSAGEAITTLRAAQDKVSDQHLPPFVVRGEEGPVGPIRAGDSVVLFNFRGDRAIQITRAFCDEDFDAFARGPRPDITFAGLMMYDGDRCLPRRFLVAAPIIELGLSERLASVGVSQWACAETQKFGHVTYFWNGNRSGRFDGETWAEIPSDRAAFDERPWMKAAEVTDAAVKVLFADRPPSLLRINYANGDMVGHTGNLDATILAVQAVDLALHRLLRSIEKAGGVAIITADHGNADQMFQIDKKSGRSTDVPMTSHTLNPVPCYLFDPRGSRTLAPQTGCGLANIAGTALEILGYEVPESWAPSLLVP